MYLLESFELGEEGIKIPKEFEGVRGANVNNRGDGQSQEEIIGRTATQLAGIKVGKSCEVGLIEKNGIEPVDATFVPGSVVRNHAKTTRGWGSLRLA